MLTNSLKYSPVKPQKLPERLIYKLSEDTYKLFSTKTGRYEGMVIARPEFVKESGIYPKMKNFWSYYVVHIHAEQKGNGAGKYLEKFVRNLSKKDERCQGRVWLRAFNNYEANGRGRASSTWWSARGYKGCDKAAQADLERVLKHQKPKHGDWYMDMDMYLPPEKIK